MINKKYELLKNKIVLYIEDEKKLQENIKDILNKFFNKVFVASDGDEAYDMYLENQNRIDIIITDINIPNIDGIALCKHIRTYNKNLPIIIISAYTNTDYLLDSINLNVLMYITKPLTSKKILSLLDKLLDYFQLDTTIIFNDNFQFDYNSGVLYIDNKKIELTQKETKFFKLLCDNKLVTYDMMYQYLWNFDNPPTQDAIKSFIRKFRKKLPDNLFKNKKGMGYYLNISS